MAERLDAETLRERRKTREVFASGPVEGADSFVTEVPYVKPLEAGETAEAVFEMFWTNMTKDRDAFAAAVRWMRRRLPSQGLGRTDDELKEWLKEFTRGAVQQNMSERGLLHPRPLDSVY